MWNLIAKLALAATLIASHNLAYHNGYLSGIHVAKDAFLKILDDAKIANQEGIKCL